MAAPFFITSTGTGIGKTLITMALCHQLRERRLKVTALKPVISGFSGDGMDSDSAQILKSCGLAPSRELIETISPWRFAAPLAPSLAAAREGRSVDIAALESFCRDHAALPTDLLLVEGAGGVMAPLNEQETMLDWMAVLAWPVVLVCGSYLGSISHALTALEVLRARHIPVRALVVSESERSDVTLNETVDGLSPLVPSDVPVVKIPRLGGDASWKQLPNISWICI